MHSTQRNVQETQRPMVCNETNLCMCVFAFLHSVLHCVILFFSVMYVAVCYNFFFSGFLQIVKASRGEENHILFHTFRP